MKHSTETGWLSNRVHELRGGRTNSDIMPLGLAQQGPRIYLVCRFAATTYNRILALNRIESAGPRRSVSTRPMDFDLEKYDADGYFGFGNGKQIKTDLSH